MSRSAKRSSGKLPARPKREKINKGRPLDATVVTLKEVNNRIKLNLDFEKSRFLDFFGPLLKDYLAERLSYAGEGAGGAFSSSFSVNRFDDFSLDKINRLKALSERQCEIFEKLLIGLNNYDISLELDISECTVKNHLQDIYLKLGVPNRYVAIARYRDLYEKLFKKSSKT
jgi:DNA-binding CsgD family transcriptional regulator